jgi:L-seryl-tRNA(Ser) seleniumtransferase
VAAGCAVVCFSGDKLLGGPQAGLMAGTAAALERCRRHPLARALRIDKLSLAALEATLRLLRAPEAANREIPVLRMLRAEPVELEARAQRMREALTRAGVAAEVRRGSARVGGGTLPLLELEGPVCALSPEDVDVEELAVRLRAQEPPVVARVAEGRLVLDPRTLDDEAAELAAGAVVAALRRG